MKRLAISLFLIPVAVLAMGERTSAPPHVKKNVAKVIDRDGISHRIEGLVCGSGGEIRFKKGSIDYRVSQTSISRIEVAGTGKDYAKVRVLFEDGDTEEYKVSTSLRCSAETDKGTVDFYIDEVKEITFERRKG